MKNINQNNEKTENYERGRKKKRKNENWKYLPRLKLMMYLLFHQLISLHIPYTKYTILSFSLSGFFIHK